MSEEKKVETGDVLEEVQKQENARKMPKVRYYITEAPTPPRIAEVDKEIITTSVHITRFQDDDPKGYLSYVEMREGEFLNILNQSVSAEAESGTEFEFIKCDMKIFDTLRKARQNLLNTQFGVKEKTTEDDFTYMGVTIKKM